MKQCGCGLFYEADEFHAGGCPACWRKFGNSVFAYTILEIYIDCLPL